MASFSVKFRLIICNLVNSVVHSIIDFLKIFFLVTFFIGTSWVLVNWSDFISHIHYSGSFLTNVDTRKFFIFILTLSGLVVALKNLAAHSYLATMSTSSIDDRSQRRAR